MKVDGTHYRTIWPEGDRVMVLDQTLFPHRFGVMALGTLADAARAIRDMHVRGAPLIGATAAWGLALAMRADASDPALARAVSVLAATRPTAINLRWALGRASAAGVEVVTELLNRRENPDYLLTTIDDAERLFDELAPSGWKLQLDTYHLGLTVDDVPAAIRRAGPRVGHVQVADVPGRHEPGTGSLDWHAIADALRRVDYGAAIGLEYHPTSDFAWIGDLTLVD